MKKLIILRGNSGSGKTTIAKKLQKKFGINTMIFRLATLSDLESIKSMYTKIVEKMLADGLNVWDTIYPVNFLENDIINNRFYIMTDGLDIVSGVAISKNHDDENVVNWYKPKAKALYIDRLGVNINYLKTGIASDTIKKVTEIAKQQHVHYIRLFVVDTNEMAIQFYEKNKFLRRDGCYKQIIDGEVILRQYAYEIEV